MKKNFKYQTIIDQNNLHDCPSDDYVEKKINGYRWFFNNDSSDELNFLPKLLLDEKLEIPTRLYSNKIKCSACGLSMYNTCERAVNRYKSLSKTIQNKLNYKFVFRIEIDETHGVVTPIDRNGHFDLHEYTSADITNVSYQEKAL